MAAIVMASRLGQQKSKYVPTKQKELSNRDKENMYYRDIIKDISKVNSEKRRNREINIKIIEETINKLNTEDLNELIDLYYDIKKIDNMREFKERLNKFKYNNEDILKKIDELENFFSYSEINSEYEIYSYLVRKIEKIEKIEDIEDIFKDEKIEFSNGRIKNIRYSNLLIVLHQ